MTYQNAQLEHHIGFIAFLFWRTDATLCYDSVWKQEV